MTDAPAPGDPAPPFTLPTTAGDIALTELLARGRVVLSFHFEDGTPTCSTQIVMLKDAHEMIEQFGASVLAVSADSIDVHRDFAARLGGVPFALASDASLDVARAYGVVDDADPRRARRAIFVIDRDGTVLLSAPHFQASNLSQVEAIFAALGAE